MAETIGSTLSKYKILKALSLGGMGSVYLGEDTSLRRRVAIKVLTPEWAEDPERFRRFRREARVLANLNHPNIVTIYSVEEADGVHFLTMEMVEGKTLAELIPAIGMGLDEIFEVAVPLADALAAAHERGVVHRDLKPANVMVSDEGRVKILDFGLAKRAVNGSFLKTGDRSLTRDGQMVGTIPYMSPEQLRGDEVDQRTDIFSFGILLYEMATGRRPFQGDSWGDLASSILRDQPPSVTVYNTRLPRHLGRIVRHCLEKEPTRRFQTALDLRNELEELRREVQSGELDVNRGDLAALERPESPVSGPITVLAPASAPASGAASSPSGVSPFPAPEAGRRRDRTLALAAAALVVAFALLLVWLRSGRELDAPPIEAPPAATDGSRRIVVFPLDNLGPAEHEYFAAGITEEITSRLSAVSALGVISRTTARNYDRDEKTVGQIGRELGVDYLLEGSVRWSTGEDGSSRVRVTPQLIRVADDTHVWSQSYDRVIDDIFAVQSEIAEEVIEQLDIALLEPEQAALASKPTLDIEAYQAYLQGMDYANRRDPTAENLSAAVEKLELATRIDPAFALAWAELSEVHSQIYHLLIDRTEARLEKARRAASRALELEPGLAAGHRALGYYYYWGHRDYERALEEFATAERALPNDSQLLEGIAYIRRRQGRFDDAIARFRKALELDPQSSRLAAELADTYITTRAYELADEICDRSIALAPNEPIPYQLKAHNYLLWRGAVEEARAMLESMPQQEALASVVAWYRQELIEGDYEAALERIEASLMRVIGDASGVYPKTMLRGQVLRLMGRPQEAALQYEGARVVLENLVRARPEDPRLRSVLGQVYAALGREQEAVRQGRLAVELMPLAEDAIRGAAFREQLAVTYANLGRADDALDLIEELLSIPAKISVPMLRIDPRWKPLRENERFRALVGTEEEPSGNAASPP